MVAKYLEIIVREKGPDGWPALTLELDYPYCPDLGKALANMLPKGTRIWAGDADFKWHIHPDFKEKVIEIAYHYFERVYLTEGTHTVEVRSGKVEPKQESFIE